MGKHHSHHKVRLRQRIKDISMQKVMESMNHLYQPTKKPDNRSNRLAFTTKNYTTQKPAGKPDSLTPSKPMEPYKPKPINNNKKI
jgi:hypothetical protein